MKALVAQELFSKRCGISAFCLDQQLFLSANDWARIPGAAVTINASQVMVEKRLATLENMCGKSLCDMDGCPIGLWNNKTCVRELEWVQIEQYQLNLRRWYSLRREHAHFIRLKAACMLQGSRACAQAVDERLLAWTNEIVMAQPALKDGEIPFLRDNIQVTNDLANRKCGSRLPCLSSLLDPIIVDGSDAAVRVALQGALHALEPLADLSAAFFEQILRNASKQFVRCGFERSRFASGSKQLCAAEMLEMGHLKLSLSRQSPWNYVTDEQTGLLEEQFKRCWLDCGLWRAAADAARTFSKLRSHLKMAFVRYVRVRCNTSSSCLRVVSNAIMQTPVLPDPPPLSAFHISRVFAVVAIAVNCTLIVGGLVIVFVIVCVWKVARLLMPILFIVVALTVGFVFDLNYYAVSLTLATHGVAEASYILVCTCSFLCVSLVFLNFRRRRQQSSLGRWGLF